MARCLDSVFGLEWADLQYEVIVVDDASTDGTVGIVKEYQQKNSNLVLLKQAVNHRQGAARNRGISVSHGDYIVFVDSDDELAAGVIQAVRLAQSANPDMVAMRTETVSAQGIVERETFLPYEAGERFSGIELQNNYQFWGTAPWMYIFRHSFLNEVNYPFAEDVFYEDSDFVNVHLYHAGRIAYCDELCYRCHKHASSTTGSLSYIKLADYALLGTRMLSFYESIKDKPGEFAVSILKGGSYNIMKAFRNLLKLKSVNEVRLFFDRYDGFYDRKSLLKYSRMAYGWTVWTRLCLKCRRLAIGAFVIVRPVLPVYISFGKGKTI